MLKTNFFMKLTIAIPSFNRLEDLKRTLASVQSLPKKASFSYEILVIDNCSDDGSYEYTCSLQKKDSRIRVVKNKKNLGRIGNWNECFKLAKGEYVLLLFTGDCLKARAEISQGITYLDKYQDIGAVWYANNELVDDRCKPHRRQPLVSMEKKFLLNYDSIIKIYEQGMVYFTPPQAFIFRKKTIQESKVKYIESLPYVSDAVFIAELFIKSKKKLLIMPQGIFDFYYTAHQFRPKNKQITKELVDIFPYLKNLRPELQARKYYSFLPLTLRMIKQPKLTLKVLLKYKIIITPNILFLKAILKKPFSRRRNIYVNDLFKKLSEVVE